MSTPPRRLGPIAAPGRREGRSAASGPRSLDGNDCFSGILFSAHTTKGPARGHEHRHPARLRRRQRAQRPQRHPRASASRSATSRHRTRSSPPRSWSSRGSAPLAAPSGACRPTATSSRCGGACRGQAFLRDLHRAADPLRGQRGVARGDRPRHHPRAGPPLPRRRARRAAHGLERHHRPPALGALRRLRRREALLRPLLPRRARRRDRDWVLATTELRRRVRQRRPEGECRRRAVPPRKERRGRADYPGHWLTAGDLGAGPEPPAAAGETRLARRIIACLDVRTNDAGDLVVTKGDQYDVRDEGEVRNLGKPVELARRYYEEGADEITFLNITSFRDLPLADQPMLEVLQRTSENVFVPLTIGGGIRDYTDPSGRHWTRAGCRQRVLPLRRRQDLDRLRRGPHRRGVPADRQGVGRVLHRADLPRLRQPGGGDLGRPAAGLGAGGGRHPARGLPDRPRGRTASASAGSSAPSKAAAKGARSTR